jgi:hypothetical protein
MTEESPEGDQLLIQLERLEGLLRESGAGVADNLETGLPADTVRASLGEVGLEASDEVVTWFAWHNGVRDRSKPGLAEVRILDAEPYSLREAIETRELLSPGPELWQWPVHMLPIMSLNGAGSGIAIDCSRPAAKTSWVRGYATDTPWDEFPEIPSLAQLVTWWQRSIQEQWQVCSPERAQWIDGPTPVPEAIWSAGVLGGRAET